MAAKKCNERSFSVELKSKADLKSVTMTNGSSENVLVEGTIGKLVQIGFTEGIILEVVGEKGVLRIDVEEDEVTQLSRKQVNDGRMTTTPQTRNAARQSRNDKGGERNG